MLYDRWRGIARAHSHNIALFDVPRGRTWTFGELLSPAEADPKHADSIIFSQGAQADFLISVLQAWRLGRVVCPLELGQARPEVLTPLPSKVVHLKLTSATTGKSRLVAFTAPQLMADCDNIVETMGLRADWPNLAVISLAHSYGFSNLVLPLLLHGIPLVLVGSALPEALRQAAESRPSVALAAVPALWQTWYDAGAIPPNVRLSISAGASLPLPLEKAVFDEIGLKLHNFYGSTECGGVAYDGSNKVRADASCVGSPLCNVSVETAEDGCLKVQSRAVAETYWPNPSPELSAGVFRTSDVGHVLDGLVHLRGRSTDQINVAGRKVLPETIEAVLSAHPEVRACLAFGVPSVDNQRGETIVACVVGKSAVPGESLRQFALSRLDAWQVPREWWFVDTLETNGRGKASRAEWRKRYLESGRAASPLKVNSARSTS
jgi:acyl-CoA synthetase (AMP-forming)/AMP-acid ligase II